MTPHSSLAPTPSKSNSTFVNNDNGNNRSAASRQSRSNLYLSTSTFSQDISRAMEASSKRPKFAENNCEHPPTPPPSPVGFSSKHSWEH